MTRRIKNAPDVRDRAAEIRRHWTSTEKRRRTGLPPDMPQSLREFILGAPQRAWCIAGGAARQSAGSQR